jgi:hypothetical protein
MCSFKSLSERDYGTDGNGLILLKTKHGARGLQTLLRPYHVFVDSCESRVGVTRPISPAVAERVSKDFKPEDHELVLSYLEEYEGGDDRGRERVLMAILKLSQGSPEDVANYVDAAKVDFRDILWWAEKRDKSR